MDWVIERAEPIWREVATELSSTEFDVQVGVVAVAAVVGWTLGAIILKRSDCSGMNLKPACLKI